MENPLLLICLNMCLHIFNYHIIKAFHDGFSSGGFIVCALLTKEKAFP